MILIACIDDGGGMMFNGRRQSRDSVLTKHIIGITAGKKLWMDKYSEKIFAPEKPKNLFTCADPLAEAGKGDYCFTEDIQPGAYEDRIEMIMLYKWNRAYPSDLLFDIPLEEHGWKISTTRDFVGTSHDKITEEVYMR